MRTTCGIPDDTGSDFGNLDYVEEHVKSDFVFSPLNSDELIGSEFIGNSSEDIQTLFKGLAAGFDSSSVWLLLADLDPLTPPGERCARAQVVCDGHLVRRP